MLNYQDKKNELKSLKAELNTAYQGINPDKVRARIAELEAAQNAEGFWNDVENAQKVSRESSQLMRKLERFEKLLGEIDDAVETVDIVELENSEEEAAAMQTSRVLFLAVLQLHDVLRFDGVVYLSEPFPVAFDPPP